MIAERRYGFRFNGMEGGLLLAGVLLASFLIFVSGVYVGREVAGRKIVVAQSPVVRLPVSSPTDQLTNKPLPLNDAAVARTATANTPLTWPVAREKSGPPSLPIAKPEEFQQKEKEKTEPMLAQTNKPSASMNAPRTVPSQTVREENLPSRTKPVAEPSTPKPLVAVASRTEKPATAQSHRVETKTPMPQTSRTEAEERKTDTQSPRSEGIAKKPSPVTIANVEKVEAVAHPRVTTTEGKRAGDEKGNETTARPRVSTAEEKRGGVDKSDDAKPVMAAAKKTAKPLAGWRVQVGATTYQETAHDMARELRELGYDPMVSKVQMNGETLYRVRIGKFGKQGEAVAAVGRFRREGRFSQAYLVSE